MYLYVWGRNLVVVHSCLCQALIKHEWGVSLADVGLHSKSSYVAWGQNLAGLAPQRGQTSLRVAKNKFLPHKKALLRDSVHQEYCPLWGKDGIGLAISDTAWYSHGFVTHLKGTPLPFEAPLMLYKCLAQIWVYHYYTCVVVVHSCLCQALIKHEWGVSLADVGLHSKSSHVAWEQNRADLAP